MVPRRRHAHAVCARVLNHVVQRLLKHVVQVGGYICCRIYRGWMTRNTRQRSRIAPTNSSQAAQLLRMQMVDCWRAEVRREQIDAHVQVWRKLLQLHHTLAEDRLYGACLIGVGSSGRCFGVVRRRSSVAVGASAPATPPVSDVPTARLRAQFEAGDLLGESHAGCARCLRCPGYTS